MSNENAPLLVEDLLLVLFQPHSGSFVGEGTLHYPLAGAVLAELAMAGQVQVGVDSRHPGRLYPTNAAHVPTDPILESAWRYVTQNPRGAQTILAAIGPALRQSVLDRLLHAGVIESHRRRVLGMFTTTKLTEGRGDRRDNLVSDLRALLIDGDEPTPRTAALAGLLAAGNALPQLHQDIPWTGPVAARAQTLRKGHWGVQAADQAVTSAIVAGISSSVLTTAVLVD